MIKSNKQLVVKIFIGFLIISMINIISYARIYHNGSSSGYDESEGERDNGNTIERYIVEGAGYYLNANSDIHKILKMVELQDIQGIDFTAVNDLLDNAIFSIKNAKETYENLIKKAESTSYNEYVISLLADFDYSNFLIEHGLNSVVFEEVKGYLKKGDITGIFISTHRTFIDILGILNYIESEISQNKLPEITIFWSLNETLSKTSIFGSYVARVFDALQKNN